MGNLAGKKLPTVEQVEIIITEYGTTGIDTLAERFGLEPAVVKATLDCLRQLRRMTEGRCSSDCLLSRRQSRIHCPMCRLKVRVCVTAGKGRILYAYHKIYR